MDETAEYWEEHRRIGEQKYSRSELEHFMTLAALRERRAARAAAQGEDARQVAESHRLLAATIAEGTLSMTRDGDYIVRLRFSSAEQAGRAFDMLERLVAKGA